GSDLQVPCWQALGDQCLRAIAVRGQLRGYKLQAEGKIGGSTGERGRGHYKLLYEAILDGGCSSGPSEAERTTTSHSTTCYLYVLPRGLQTSHTTRKCRHQSLLLHRHRLAGPPPPTPAEGTATAHMPSGPSMAPYPVPATTPFALPAHALGPLPLQWRLMQGQRDQLLRVHRRILRPRRFRQPRRRWQVATMVLSVQVLREGPSTNRDELDKSQTYDMVGPMQLDLQPGLRKLAGNAKALKSRGSEVISDTEVSPVLGSPTDKDEVMEVGSNVLICGGSRPHLVGARAMVLPAASGAASSHTVVLTDNRHDRRGRVLTMDTANLQLAARRHLLGDDGMNVPLRWLLYPPPLTRFTARWLLGWSSYSTVVPEKPLHRDQLRALQRAQEAKAAAEPPKEARVKLQPRDKSRLAPAESSTTGSASSRPGCETSEASAGTVTISTNDQMDGAPPAQSGAFGHPEGQGQRERGRPWTKLRYHMEASFGELISPKVVHLATCAFNTGNRHSNPLRSLFANLTAEGWQVLVMTPSQQDWIRICPGETPATRRPGPARCAFDIGTCFRTSLPLEKLSVLEDSTSASARQWGPTDQENPGWACFAQRTDGVHALHRSQGRLLVMTWNAGGLSSALWHGLLLTLQNLQPAAPPQIICVQESHWKDTVAPTFVTANWQAYCSPTTDSKSAGLVTLIDKSLLSQCQVLFADPHPGRVQHIRVVHSAWSVDLLNIYQKTYNSHPRASSDSKAVREAVWQCIHDQIQRVPQRSTLVLMGDFNSGTPRGTQSSRGIKAMWAAYHEWKTLARTGVRETIATEVKENLPPAEPNFVGIQLSLDLSSAFDLVVMSWYHCITYYISHLGKQDNMTTYADDIHLRAAEATAFLARLRLLQAEVPFISQWDSLVQHIQRKRCRSIYHPAPHRPTSGIAAHYAFNGLPPPLLSSVT
ncbi:unnamed protein product, partial [Symbiodinium microadriaticum]